MEYKIDSNYDKSREFAKITVDNTIYFDPEEYNDPCKSIEEKFQYFFETAKRSDVIPFIIHELPIFWEYIDRNYLGTLCFLEAMHFIPIETIDSMFGIDNIAQKIKQIPNDATAAIAILIYPEYKKKIFPLEAIIYESFNDDKTPKDRYVFVKLLTQQYVEYEGEITIDILLRYSDTRCQSSFYLNALIDMYVKYVGHFPELLDNLHDLKREKEESDSE